MKSKLCFCSFNLLCYWIPRSRLIHNRYDFDDFKDYSLLSVEPLFIEAVEEFLMLRKSEELWGMLQLSLGVLLSSIEYSFISLSFRGMIIRITFEEARSVEWEKNEIWGWRSFMRRRGSKESGEGQRKRKREWIRDWSSRMFSFILFFLFSLVPSRILGTIGLGRKGGREEVQLSSYQSHRLSDYRTGTRPTMSRNSSRVVHLFLWGAWASCLHERFVHFLYQWKVDSISSSLVLESFFFS